MLGVGEAWLLWQHLKRQQGDCQVSLCHKIPWQEDQQQEGWQQLDTQQRWHEDTLDAPKYWMPRKA